MHALTPREIARFLDVGYLVLHLEDVEDSIHDRIFQACEAMHRGSAATANPSIGLNLIADNINTTIPELNAILGSPQLDGALTSLVGPEHFRYNHSFIHKSSTTDQSFHKDSGLPWGTRNGIRSHRLNAAMVFYYPQETTVEMGATEILPGSQYWSVDRENTGATAGEDRLDLAFENDKINDLPDLNKRDQRLRENVETFDSRVQPLRLELPKGSVVLVHFDLFHRGTRQALEQSRYMVKFWYFRMVEPVEVPSSLNETDDCEDPRTREVVQECMAWLGHRNFDIREPENAPNFCTTLNDACFVQSAYRLAKERNPRLLKHFASDHETKRRAATQALTVTGSFGIKTAFANCNSESHHIRMCGAFLLGEVGDLSQELVETLCAIADLDNEKDARITAINALGRLVRRHQNPDSECAFKIIETLIRIAKTSAEQGNRRNLQQSAERQAAYLASLTIVTALDPKEYSRELSRLSEFMASSVYQERDRYAKGTAVEIICRLAVKGNPIANNCAVDLLRNERLNSMVGHA